MDTTIHALSAGFRSDQIINKIKFFLTKESMHIKNFSHLILCASIASLSLTLHGCAAIPAAIAAVNGATKTSVAKFTVEGPRSAKSSFRDATIKAGGVVTTSSDDYSKSEFADVSVKVEIQTIKQGEYQVIGSSNTTVARTWEFKDNIGEMTKKIVDAMVLSGFKVTSSTKS